jgi:16S rRNA (cytosine967-C5)-methyltransferase
VSETVAATRHKPWSKGLVNAVLRHFQRDIDTLEACCDNHPSAQFNHPDWMIELLTSQWPEQAEALFAANDQAAPMTLRVNRLQSSREHYQALLADAGIDATSLPLTAAGLQLHQAVSVEQLPGFSAGQVSVQDAAAQLAAGLLQLAPGQRVLDMCAAPGGKTAAILEQQPALQSLLALDSDPQRLHRLDSNLQRLGLQAELRCANASHANTWADGRLFDRILLDAPCSGLGVIRRHPDIKLLRRASDIAALVTVQQQLLDAAWSVLAPGGLLLYATCSVLKSENEWQIAAFLERHSDAHCLPINADWGMERPHGRQILSGQDGMDGFYYAQVSKPA